MNANADPDFDSDPVDISSVSPSNSYALSGKIMLTAIIILFFLIIIMISLHIYARYYLIRIRRRNLLNRARNRRRSHPIFFIDQHNTVPVPSSRGLDPSVLNSCPIFSYSSKTCSDSLECAVCLSEFEDEEICRLLPKCKHSFHIECIDMWFGSNSSCPLCRSVVEPGDVVVVSVGEPGSSSESLPSETVKEETRGTRIKLGGNSDV